MGKKAILLAGRQVQDAGLTAKSESGRPVFVTFPVDLVVTVDPDDEDPNAYWFDYRDSEFVCRGEDLRKVTGGLFVEVPTPRRASTPAGLVEVGRLVLVHNPGGGGDRMPKHMLGQPLKVVRIIPRGGSYEASATVADERGPVGGAVMVDDVYLVVQQLEGKGVDSAGNRQGDRRYGLMGPGIAGARPENILRVLPEIESEEELARAMEVGELAVKREPALPGQHVNRGSRLGSEAT